MTQQDKPHSQMRWSGVALVVSYVFLSFLWVVTLSGLVVYRAVHIGIPLEQLNSQVLFERLGTMTFALQSLVQATGFVSISALLVVGLGRLMPTHPRERLGDVYGFRACPPRFLVMGFIGGLIVGIFPGWVVEQFKQAMPQIDLGTIDLIHQLFQQRCGRYS